MGKTIADYIYENKLPIPNTWYNSKMKNKVKNPKFIE